MNVKEVGSKLVFIMWLCFSSLVSAKSTVILDNQNQVFDGVLGDKDQYAFRVDTGQAISISIEQINADVKIVLSEKVNGKISNIYQLSTPADTWLNELLYITSDDCTHCIVTILPQENIAQSGKYRFKYMVRSSVDPIEKSIMNFATQGAIAWQKSTSEPSKFVESMQASLSMFKQASDLSKLNNRFTLQIRNLYLASQTAHYLSDYDLQKKYLLEILKHKHVSNSPISLRANFQLSILTQNDNQLKTTEHKLKQLLQDPEVEKNELIKAIILQSLGKIAAEERKLSKALGYFKRSMDIFESHAAWQNMINLLGELGWTYRHQGKLDLALNHFLQALSMAQQFSHERLVSELNVSIAYLYRIKGDINQANVYISLALETSHKFNGHFVDGRAKQEKARGLMVMGDFERAIDVLNDASLAYKKVGATTDIVNVNYLLSLTHTKLGNYSSALNYAQNVLENDLKTGVNDDIGNAYNQLATINLGLKNYPEALHSQQLALDYFSDTEDTYTLAKAYSQAAEIFFHNNNSKQSDRYFIAAREQFQKNDNLLGLLDTEYRFAKIQSIRGNNSLVLATLKKLVAQIDKLQQTIKRGDLRRSYLALQQDVSSLYIDTLSQLDTSPKEMLVISEIFRGRTLSEAIQKTTKKQNDSKEFKSLKLTLHQELQSQVVTYETLASHSERQKIAKKARHIAAQLQKIDVKNKAQNKEAHSEFITLPLNTPMNIKTIQESLNQEDLILYFDTGKQHSHLWTITRTKLQHFVLPNENIIASQVESLIANISSAPTSRRSKNRQGLNAAINILSKTLFANTGIQWERYQNLIVIPDGPLHSAIFSLLKIGADHSPILQNMSVSYLPSLNIYQHLMMADNNIDDNDQLLLIANPSMQSKVGITNKAYIQTRGGFHSTELPFTQVEADAIEHILANNITLLTREQASKQNLLKESLNKFDILHFATHGISYSYTSSIAGLVLSNNTTDDNLILAPQISQLNIPAKLVVLSGCETAQGKLVNGEGLMGLSRAFFEAGTKSVIASLWSVQDKATAELMKQFYQYLFQQNLPASEALRLAKLDVKNFRKRNGHRPWRDPYYWSGFIYQGAV